MSEWKEYKVEDIISEISMGPFGSDVKKEVYTSFGVPILNGANLQGFKLKEDSFGYVSEEKANSLKKCNAHRGDVVVTHRGTLGQIVYIPENSKFDRYVISQSQFRFTCNNNIVRPDFLVYLFHTKEGQHKILSNASQVGVPALARATTTFRQIKVKIPSLIVQDKIMNILSSLDDKIEVNRRINEQLEELAQALFKSWFVDFEPFKDGEFVESEFVKLGDVVKTTSGGTPSRKHMEYYGGNNGWVKSKELNGTFIVDTEETITDEAIAKSSAKLLPAKSILIAMYGATVGQYAILSKAMTCNQAVCALLPNDNYPYTYLFMYAKNKKDELINKAVGSAQQNISQILIKDLDISNDIQKIKDYHKIVSPAFEIIEKNQQEITHLTNLRDTLLPKLMSGEIDVNDVEI